MRSFGWMLGALTLSATLVGCGSSQDEAAQTEANREQEAVAALREFLEAVKTGDNAKAEDMLTPTAREKTREADLVVTPPSRDTAEFEIREAKFVAEDGVHIETIWSDVGPDNQRQEDDIVWMLRKEDTGWRVAGMGAKPFKDQTRVYLNFEDPDDMKRKLELIDAEFQRRAGQEPLQAEVIQPPGDNSIRR